jgi:class 3 adenylate cyclase
MAEMQARSWTWEFDHPPATVWSMMADTARLNEASGLPLHDIQVTNQPDGSVLTTGEAKIGWVDLKWREVPVNWITDQWFEHNRVFEHGPLAFLGAQLQLEPSKRGTRLTYRISAAPANWFGHLLLKTNFFPSIERSYAKMAASANAFAKGEGQQVFPFKGPEISPVLQERIDQAVAQIEATPYGHGLARQLADHVMTAQEVDLWHIRPLVLARLWRRPALQVIELCLQAVRSGLLELRWDLLCPGCRGSAKDAPATLDRLPTGSHCPSCNIDFDRDFSRNVEANFRPAASIRNLETGEYCISGPMSVPHVKAQVTLKPAEARDLPAQLAAGPYRIRSFEAASMVELDWPEASADRGFPSITLTDDAILLGDPASPGQLRLVNRSDHAVTAIIEDRRWVADALTADRVTALQAFRDLFASDVLRPGDDVAIGHIALLFTDLKGSTALYRRIGDAAAYGLVRNHFAFLTQLVRAHEGTVVKTIGDAVMAAFHDDHQAVAAALAIQNEVKDFNRENGLTDGLVIKLGIHAGPTIAVTLNDRLDYFGTVVNMAARLQGQSLGGDLVISNDIAADAAVADLLTDHAVAADKALLKGFDQPQPFLRIARNK